MGIKLGNTTIGGMYLGSIKIAAAYIGSTKVFEASNATSWPPRSTTSKGGIK